MAMLIYYINGLFDSSWLESASQSKISLVLVCMTTANTPLRHTFIRVFMPLCYEESVL